MRKEKKMIEQDEMQKKKDGKLCELKDLIAQYDAGERETLNAWEYPKWVLTYKMLKEADIDEEIFDAFLANPSHYKVVDKQIVFNPEWEREEREKEERRIAQLHMTKLDFFKFVLQPFGITYAALQEILHADDALNATFQLCNHVYRGDEKLNEFIFAKIPALTPEELTRIFEAHAVAE